MKAKIKKYKVTGKVFIWKYKDNLRNYPGWNFTVDIKASQSLLRLLELMNNCEWSSQNIITTEIPTELQIRVPNNQNGNARWKTKKNLKLKCIKTMSETHWLINEMENEVEIQFGKAKLEEFKNAITGIPEGKGDFDISDQNAENIMFFWWNLNN